MPQPWLRPLPRRSSDCAITAAASTPLPALLCFLAALPLLLGIASFMSAPRLSLPFPLGVGFNALAPPCVRRRSHPSGTDHSDSQSSTSYGTPAEDAASNPPLPLAGKQVDKGAMASIDVTRIRKEIRPDSGRDTTSTVSSAADADVCMPERIQSETSKCKKSELGQDFNSMASSQADLTQEGMQSDVQSCNKTRHSVSPAEASLRNTTADGCDLFEGSWIRDPLGPLYSSDSCPVLSQHQNCRINGRPDNEYENWRWQPTDCQLPRFDVHLFLQIMKGKTLAFVGDSVARNQMESLMCIIWQVEIPRHIRNKKMQHWYFRSHAVTIIRIWSAWLVRTSTAAFQFAPENLTKLHLEEPDQAFMNFLPKFDVLVLSSGHWLAKKTAYISNNEVVGGQLWWDKHYPLQLKNTDAFPITLRTALKAVVSNPEYKGLTIFRTYSPDHYEEGGWNTGGSCSGRTQPLADTEVAFNVYTELMRKHQLEAFKEMEHGISNGSKLRLMDITPVFSYRADGHPGLYRSPDTKKATKRDSGGQPATQDCLHWCMPGPVDTWNEFLLEILRQEMSEFPQKY